MITILGMCFVLKEQVPLSVGSKLHVMKILESLTIRKQLYVPFGSQLAAYAISSQRFRMRCVTRSDPTH